MLTVYPDGQMQIPAAESKLRPLLHEVHQVEDAEQVLQEGSQGVQTPLLLSASTYPSSHTTPPPEMIRAKLTGIKQLVLLVQTMHKLAKGQALFDISHRPFISILYPSLQVH